MTSNDPSEDVFWMLYDPERMTMDDAAIQVAEAQTLLGDHAPSWAALVLLHDPEEEIVDTANTSQNTPMGLALTLASGSRNLTVVASSAWIPSAAYAASGDCVNFAQVREPRDLRLR